MSLFQFAELVVAFVLHLENGNVQVAMMSMRGQDFPVRCIVALLRKGYEHAFFVKSFHAKFTMKKASYTSTHFLMRLGNQTFQSRGELYANLTEPNICKLLLPKTFQSIRQSFGLTQDNLMRTFKLTRRHFWFYLRSQ
jgi:hypothetical protein